jgi:hypothetical protein
LNHGFGFEIVVVWISVGGRKGRGVAIGASKLFCNTTADSLSLQSLVARGFENVHAVDEVPRVESRVCCRAFASSKRITVL